jgi:lysophospholipase L1-like esterase
MTKTAWVVGLTLVAGCAPAAGPQLTASASHASQFGYVPMTFTGDVAALGEVRSVTLAGIPAYAVQTTPTSLTVTIQGAPDSGPAELVVDGSRARTVQPDALIYDPPTTGVPLRWAAFGASVTQGTESTGIDEHTQLYGVTAQLARVAGVYLPLPIFDSTVLPRWHADAFAPDCSGKPQGALDLTSFNERVTDSATGLYDLRRARASVSTVPHNFAAGGSKVEHVLRGGAFFVAVLEHIVEDPTIDGGDAFVPPARSQIDRLEALDPDVGFCTDLMDNDLLPAVNTNDIIPGQSTPVETIRPMLTEMMGRLGKLHGHYFIANALPVTHLPNTVEVRARRIQAGLDTDETMAMKLQAIDALTDAYNAALADAMRPYPNLHLLDFHAMVEDVQTNGVVVGDERLSIARFGGFLSFDNLHPSDTGYTTLANFFLQQINTTLGSHIPTIDVIPVLAQDELDPAKLRARGFTCVPPAS